MKFHQNDFRIYFLQDFFNQQERIVRAVIHIASADQVNNRHISCIGFINIPAFSRILRPANYAPQTPGRGWAVYDSKAGSVAVIDLIGRCNMDYGPDNPFLLVEKILKKIDTKIILVEFHAEATSEKLAMGYMLDGRVSAVWGTHTHVPTADNQVLPGGTGYVTDLGMTGPKNSVLGIRPDLSIARFRGDLTERYRWAEGPTKLEGVLFTIDSATGKCLKAERVDEWD